MIMFGYCLGVKCVCFHKMGYVKVISKSAGDDNVLMSPCLIWELETERSFLCFVFVFLSSSFLPCVAFF